MVTYVVMCVVNKILFMLSFLCCVSGMCILCCVRCHTVVRVECRDTEDIDESRFCLSVFFIKSLVSAHALCAAI